MRLLLARRTRKHIILRGVAEWIDIVLLFVARDILEAAFGENAVWIAVPAMLLYFILLESLLGFTLGKRIFELRVVGATGKSPTIWESIVRNILRPFEGFGLIGVFFVAATERGQRVGDLLASTFVVRGDELEKRSQATSALATNELPASREILSLTPQALEAAKRGIEGAYSPEETGLSVSECSDCQYGLSVQYDLIDLKDDCWHWTTDGVTVSVPRSIAKQCGLLVIDCQDGRLVVKSPSE
ncbi:MAG TPA: RDD family protein [Thermoguttaceae bacterium]|nr:RDD family protein [Thermoguttaceae bacterium]